MRTNYLKKLRAHKAFRMLVLSFLLLIVVSLAFAAVSHDRLLKTERERAKEQALANLTQAVYIVENYFDSIYQAMISLSLDEEVNLYLYRTAPMDGSDYYRMIQAQKEISMGNVYNTYVYEMGVYVQKLDTVLYSSSCRRTEGFYDAFLDFEGMTKEEWHESLNINEDFDVKPARYSRASGKWLFEFKLSAPITSNLGAIIAYMDVGLIENVFSSGSMLEDGGLTIERDGQTLLSIGNGMQKNMPAGWNMFDGKETLTVSKAGDDGRVYYLTLGESIYLEQVTATKNHILKMLLIEMAGICILSLVMIYVNYTPLRRLLHKLGLNSTESMSYRETEYDHILNAASDIIKTSENLTSQLQKQLPLLKRSLILQMATTDAGIARETLDEYGIKFTARYFTVACMHVGRADETGAVLRYSVAAMIENRYCDKEKIYCAECSQDAILLLINTPHTQIYGLLEDICLFLKDNMALETHIGAGNTTEDTAEIHLSFEKAMEALTYARAWQHKDIVLSEELKGFEQNDVYTQLDEQELISHFRAGDTLSIHKEIRRLYDNVENAPATHAQIMTYGIVTTCLRLLNEWKISGENVDGAIERITHLISNSEPTEALFAEVIRLTDEISQTVAAMKSASTSTIGEEAKKVIEENFMKDDFSLAQAAEIMNLSPPYLSHVFKQQNGETFINTLNCVRLEAACRLLKTTELSVSAIAKMCGYSDAGYFNRVFKKKYQMPPGQYRESDDDNC